MFNTTAETVTAFIIVYVCGYLHAGLGFILDELQEYIRERRKKKKEQKKEDKDECNT